MTPFRAEVSLASPSQPAKVMPSEALFGRGMGVMFQAFFGAVWLALASLAAGSAGPLQLGSISLGALLIFAFGLSAVRRNRHAVGRAANSVASVQRARRFTILNAVQWAAIIGLIVTLNLIGLQAWIPAGIILIVGLHFLPLAALFHYRLHLLTGSALTLLALSYPFLVSGGPASPVGPFCAGLVIWTTAIGMLIDIALHERR